VDVPEVGSREQQKISSLVPSSFKLSGVYKCSNSANWMLMDPEPAEPTIGSICPRSTWYHSRDSRHSLFFVTLPLQRITVNANWRR